VLKERNKISSDAVFGVGEDIYAKSACFFSVLSCRGFVRLRSWSPKLGQSMAKVLPGLRQSFTFRQYRGCVSRCPLLRRLQPGADSGGLA